MSTETRTTFAMPVELSESGNPGSFYDSTVFWAGQVLEQPPVVDFKVPEFSEPTSYPLENSGISTLTPLHTGPEVLEYVNLEGSNYLRSGESEIAIGEQFSYTNTSTEPTKNLLKTEAHKFLANSTVTPIDSVDNKLSDSDIKKEVDKIKLELIGLLTPLMLTACADPERTFNALVGGMVGFGVGVLFSLHKDDRHSSKMWSALLLGMSSAVFGAAGYLGGAGTAVVLGAGAVALRGLKATSDRFIK
jgi:hypothetical protein